VLVAQIVVANIARQYGVAGIRIDRGNVVVDSPKYSGVGSDGSRYVVTATEARTPIDKPDMITMTNATLEFTKPGGSAMFGKAKLATMDTASQIVVAPGVVDVSGEDGLTGTLTDFRSDMAAEITTANGPVDITLSDGTNILGSTMLYDGKASLWTFTDATVTMNDLPGAEDDLSEMPTE